MRDLLVTTHTPVLRSGQAVRTYGVARALAANRGLTLLYVRFEAPEPDEAFRSIPGIELQEVVPSRGLSRLASYGGARLAGVPAGFARGISAELASESERLAADPDRGRVIADGPIAAAALRRLSGRRPVIYNAHNVESSFRGELDDGAGTRGLRRFERGLPARVPWNQRAGAEVKQHDRCDQHVAVAIDRCDASRTREDRRKNYEYRRAPVLHRARGQRCRERSKGQHQADDVKRRGTREGLRIFATVEQRVTDLKSNGREGGRGRLPAPA